MKERNGTFKSNTVSASIVSLSASVKVSGQSGTWCTLGAYGSQDSGRGVNLWTYFTTVEAKTKHA